MYLSGTSKINNKNHLEIGGVDTVELVKQFGTPLYVFDETAIREKINNFKDAFKETGIPFRIAYASKALCTMAICYLVKEEGLSLDVVSGGELYTALKANFPAERIHFHGNNKSLQEIEMGVKANIGAFVIDNFYELDLIEEVAKRYNKKVNALIRVTPGIEAHTHEYIQTGQEDSKFGFNIPEPALTVAKKVHESSWINLIGFHFHIGSQIFDMTGFDKAIEKIAEFYILVQEELCIEVPILNAGGGFGIRYTKEDKPLSPKDYVSFLIKFIKHHFSTRNLNIPEVWIEPGRSLVGDAGTTLYTIGSDKNIPGIRKYIAVDGGMMDNPRPALYKAKYEAVIANRVNSETKEKVTVAGKACESGDILIWDTELNSSNAGDILAVFSTGAYNYSMSSNYNRIPRPAAVLVSNGKADVIVRRETYDDLIQNDVVPDRFVINNQVSIIK